MTRDAKANLRYLARSTTATIALVAGGYLVISGSTAEPATGESTDKSRKNETWIEKSYVARSEVRRQGPGSGAGRHEASKDGKSIAASKSSNTSRKEDKLVQKAFRPGPKYETNYDAEEQARYLRRQERGRAAAPAA